MTAALQHLMHYTSYWQLSLTFGVNLIQRFQHLFSLGVQMECLALVGVDSVILGHMLCILGGNAPLAF